VHSERRRGKPRSRILYWFRTPPGVRVGRAALDEDAIRLIEELNPFIQFDWARILKGQGAPPSEPRVPHDTRRQRPPARDVPAERDERLERPIEESGTEPEPAREADVQSQLDEESGIAPADEAIGGFEEAVEDLRSEPTPAHERLGAEGVQRLRARYAELLARISERVADPARRDELRARAESLNPDSWVTREEVAQGLEQYEPLLASFREVLGRRRRRKRRGNRRPEITGAPSDTSVDQNQGADTGTPASEPDPAADAAPGTDEPTDDL
jgi:hypothetical protein